MPVYPDALRVRRQRPRQLARVGDGIPDALRTGGKRSLHILTPDLGLRRRVIM
jgi:hypothetical protein